jgi:ribosomal protein S18 acetylase RimI-like enzyme
VHSLAVEDLASAREVLTHSFSLDEAGAITVIPDTAIQDDSTTVWGLSEGDQLLATVTIVREDGLAVVWSMATRSESQRRGYGRRLLETVLAREFHDGATGSLLNSSKAGERLYRELGFSAVDYLQLWSRPRWVLGAN